jgi:hypothetical protein
VTPFRTVVVLGTFVAVRTLTSHRPFRSLGTDRSVPALGGAAALHRWQVAAFAGLVTAGTAASGIRGFDGRTAGTGAARTSLHRVDDLGLRRAGVT